MEGVQFHPESVLTTTGRTMLQNFLKMRGGRWDENESFRKGASKPFPIQEAKESDTNGVLVNGHSDRSSHGDGNPQESILEKIYRHRRLALQAQQSLPSQRWADLQTAYDLNLAPPLISFVERLRKSPFSLSLMAEFKRASPSKGTISMDVSAPRAARSYAHVGASVISVGERYMFRKGHLLLNVTELLSSLRANSV